MPDGSRIAARERADFFLSILKGWLSLERGNQSSFCQDYGLDPSAVSRYLSTGNGGRGKVLSAFAKKVGLSVEELEQLRDSDSLLQFTPANQVRRFMQPEEPSNNEVKLLEDENQKLREELESARKDRDTWREKFAAASEIDFVVGTKDGQTLSVKKTSSDEVRTIALKHFDI